MIEPGQSYPLGATPQPGGVNFSVYSKHCEALELLLFDGLDAARPSRVIELDPSRNHRTFHYWHAFVPGIGAGQVYAYRAKGPWEPGKGLRYDPEKVLLDPYGKAVAVPHGYDREAARRPGDTSATAMRSVVADLSTYDWEGDAPPAHSFLNTVIYEMHVRGFTRHPSSGVPGQSRGTYAGLIEKIPYLQDLGITAVELLPVFQYDPQEAPPGLVNYWGYNPISFFAPHFDYASSSDPLGVLDEFRDMVKALHRAGLEVILDVVYNHTAEGDEDGATLSFRGLDNRSYYSFEGADRAKYANFSGTGNTLNANHAVVRRMILDSLRHWVTEMHVDGFRFDLASILSRDVRGNPVPNPPVLWDIETDPVLSGTKLIAEAWDASGLYQVGSFFGDHWKEWNGRFRDDVRSFMRGEHGHVEKLAVRFLASPDIYAHKGREAEQSINFVTCHDGFTLNDLVSYDEKHNLANDEQNRDGTDDNRSWNCGVEGPTDDPEIEQLRNQQIRNFHTTNLLSLGVPMVLMGDEARRTQLGNNNAYCHDSELSWFDWSLLEQNAGLHRFVKKLIGFRKSVALETPEMSLADLLKAVPVHWHGIKLNEPDVARHSRSLAFTVEGFLYWWHFMFNAYVEPLTFELPSLDGEPTPGWLHVIDTYRPAPHDFAELADAELIADGSLVVQPHSIVVLVSKRGAS